MVQLGVILVSSRISVRSARIEDAPAMGEIHVRAWQIAYINDFPITFLNGLDPRERAEMWATALDQGLDKRSILVAEDGDVICGFVVAGSGSSPTSGELLTLNVDPQRWGQGIGSSLVTAANSVLQGSGFLDAELWVLSSNVRARALYERFGWTSQNRYRDANVLGADVRELCYCRSFKS